MVRTAVILLIMIAAVVFFGQKGEDDEIQVQLPQDNGTVEQTEESETKEAKQNIYIDISGQVKKPGVYQVKEGTRLFEIIEMAGGLSAKADKDGFNQAEVVADGEKIIIPAKGSDVTGVSSGSNPADGLININSADSAALQAIPGVGPVTADKIVAYRDEHGRFSSKEEIKNVSGIGEKTYEKMKDKIKV